MVESRTRRRGNRHHSTRTSTLLLLQCTTPSQHNTHFMSVLHVSLCAQEQADKAGGQQERAAAAEHRAQGARPGEGKRGGMQQMCMHTCTNRQTKTVCGDRQQQLLHAAVCSMNGQPVRCMLIDWTPSLSDTVVPLLCCVCLPPHTFF